MYAALAEYGGPISGATPEDFTDRYAVFQIGVSPVRIDILGSVQGVRFSSAWEKRVRTAVGEGLHAPFISKPDLIKAKKAAGRDLDKIDVQSLQKRN